MFIKLLKPLVFVAALWPVVDLGWRALQFSLGANPVETIIHQTGDWALRFLLITLAVTPLRRLFGWQILMRFRRTLGLYAFFYTALHFATYLVLDQSFAWAEIKKDILERPHITVGFVALVLLIPMAVTSTNKMMRRLGKRWKQLHQLVYVCATLGVVHYLLLVKADLRAPFIYAAVLLVLLGVRAYYNRVANGRPTRPVVAHTMGETHPRVG